MQKNTGVSLKAFLVGSFLTLILSIFEPYLVLVYNAQGFTFDFITAGAIVLFFIFVGGINVVLGKINEKYALNSSELIVVYIMLIIGSAIPSMGFVLQLIPLISGLFYFATPANGYIDRIIPHIKPLIAPTDPLVHKYLYEGLPEGVKLPWSAWFIPLLSWIILMLVICLVSLSIMVILRKQWVVNERLIFPLTVIPFEMIREEGKESIIKPFFKNKLMWMGFFIAFIFMSWNGIAKYFPFMTPLNLCRWYPFMRGTTAIGFTFSFVLIGFTYFINLDIALSFWFFHLLSKVLTGFFSITGMGLKGRMAPFEEGQLPSITQVCMGAMVVLVLYGLWTARAHLKNVFLKILNKNKGIDDSDEIMSYRTCFIIITAGIIFIMLWLKFTGLSFIISPYFIFILFVIFIGMTRIMAEGGVGFGKPPSMPMSYLTHTVPTEILGDSGMTSIALSTSYSGDIRTLFMTSAANSLKLISLKNMKKYFFVFIILFAVLLSAVGALLTTLIVAYNYGGASLQTSPSNPGWFFTSYPQTIWDYVILKLNNPTTVSEVLERWSWAILGGIIMFILMWLQHTFIWWPIHYIGFPVVASNLFTHSWLCIFIGWLVKSLILKYGGVKIYRELKPFFLGLIVGQLVCALFWSIICIFTGIRTGTGVMVGLP